LILLPEVTWPAADLKDPGITRQLKLVEQPAEPVFRVCAEALMQRNARLKIIGLLVLVGSQELRVGHPVFCHLKSY
jgi:hypothetical protein